MILQLASTSFLILYSTTIMFNKLEDSHHFFKIYYTHNLIYNIIEV